MWDNILIALQSLRANKMRALLTMLGIIIGIGSVIAIETLGNSLNGSITTSLSDFGASDITVSLTQKESGDEAAAQDVRIRMFMSETPDAADRITDAMLDEYHAAFPNRV
ncbi:MAG: ABC transporter permease, partial [Oscillospiraceae bacterium]|nr:ABC transporter permease [Oscillospiraceae bacterium]